MIGALQGPSNFAPLRQLINPLPYWPASLLFLAHPVELAWWPCGQWPAFSFSFCPWDLDLPHTRTTLRLDSLWASTKHSNFSCCGVGAQNHARDRQALACVIARNATNYASQLKKTSYEWLETLGILFPVGGILSDLETYCEGSVCRRHLCSC